MWNQQHSLRRLSGQFLIEKWVSSVRIFIVKWGRDLDGQYYWVWQTFYVIREISIDVAIFVPYSAFRGPHSSSCLYGPTRVWFFTVNARRRHVIFNIDPSEWKLLNINLMQWSSERAKFNRSDCRNLRNLERVRRLLCRIILIFVRYDSLQLFPFNRFRSASNRNFCNLWEPTRICRACLENSIEIGLQGKNQGKASAVGSDDGIMTLNRAYGVDEWQFVSFLLWQTTIVWVQTGGMYIHTTDPRCSTQLIHAMTNFRDVPSINLVKREIGRYNFNTEHLHIAAPRLLQAVAQMIRRSGFEYYDLSCIPPLQSCSVDFYQDLLIRFKQHLESLGSESFQAALERTLSEVMHCTLYDLQCFMRDNIDEVWIKGMLFDTRAARKHNTQNSLSYGIRENDTTVQR